VDGGIQKVQKDSSNQGTEHELETRDNARECQGRHETKTGRRQPRRIMDEFSVGLHGNAIHAIRPVPQHNVSNLKG
jgi:hypothetical protein